MSSPKPTLVLVPGACLTTPVFDLFLPLLEKAGYPTATLQVASADPPDPQAANATADAAALRNQLLPLLDAGKELVLVLHSYAGVPGGGAVAGLSKTVRAQQRKRGGVVGMVWMAAIVLPEGRESGEWAGLGKKGGGEEVNRYHDPAPGLTSIITSALASHIYNDVPPESATMAHMSKHFVPHAISALASVAPPQVWQTKEFKGRVGYIKCTLDKIISLDVQESMLEKSVAEGKEGIKVEWAVKELEAGHCPWASKADDTSKAIVELVEGFQRA